MHSDRIDQSTMEQTKERSPPQLNYSHNESCLLLPINQCVPRQWLLTGTQVMPQSSLGVDSVVDENLSISAAAAAPTTKEPQSHPLDKY